MPPRFRGIVSRLLLGGLALSSVLLVAGLAAWGVESGQVDLSVGSRPAGVGAFFSSLAAGQWSAILLLGLLVLSVTPIARVTVSAGLFRVAHDRQFFRVTAAVLVALALSALVGVLL